MCRTYMHCVITDTIVLLISVNSWFFLYQFFFNLDFSFGYPNWSETPWVFRKYISNISIFCFYFGGILKEGMQVRGRAFFSDVSQFFVKVRTGEKIGLLGEYLPYGWPYYFFFFRMTRMCATWCLWNLSTFDYTANIYY